ncbi:MAG: CHAT domain-containing protein [Sterolibacteriaceae bacterium]|uniref:CHAT domain-containing protein n=1 Tax=Candidatus Methylophosphatis roskildensis TaxID=2899263 RepID=A0A9D7EBV4_9PROT|nr:CHAT domain-containing protein [Candidatus Methylophosphatis roskildensis]MBK7237985.1 CHAT domain-containing protein [Sterolibacteriaceae bacterium]
MSDLVPADAVVVCRPEQMREAATVLSCFAQGVLPPLFVLEHAPCSETRYRTLHERYRAMRDRRDEDVGTLAARLALDGKRKAPGWRPKWSNEEIDRRVEALTPYRRWVKRHRLLAAVYHKLPLRRAIFLVAATADDMSVIEPQPKGVLGTAREPLLAEGLQWIVVASEGDEPFWHRAWRAVRPGEPLPAEAIDVGGDGVALIAGLHRARRKGLPLRVRDGATASGFAIEPASGDAASEAVVVEASDKADALAAVFYALRQDALLCVYPQPSTRSIERARQAIEVWQEGPHAAGDVAPIAELEAAVARAVPDAVAGAVGTLPLTAWTGGVPYHLLRRPGCDWSDKPIGLMTGDALLLAALALFDASDTSDASETRDPIGASGGRVEATPSPLARLHVVFDPGDFPTGETEGVLRALAADPGFALLLQGPAASNTALIAAGGAPLELVYFNTHGSDDSIALKDMPLPGYKLLQRVTMRSRPLVFNNSCLSWTGVGREFLVAGARGYVGTLWSVDARNAAAFAIAAMDQLVAGGRTIAASLRGSRVDPATEKAYVFVGAVSARLRAAGASALHERERMNANATLLVEMGLSLCHEGPSDSPLIAAEVQTLLAQAEAIAAAIDERWPEPDRATLPLLTRRLDLARQLDFGNEQNVRRCVDMGKRGLKLAGDPNDETTSDLEGKAAFWLACSRVSRKLERWADMVTLLSFSIQNQEKAGRTVSDEYLDRSDAYLKLGERDLATSDAEHAQSAFTAAADAGDADARRGAMLAAGRLAGLYRKTGRLDAALAAALDGHRAAVVAEDLLEQASFKMDESSIRRTTGDSAAAVAAADEALATVRRARNEDKEIEAFGTLTLALLAARESERALLVAQDGLAAARRRGQAAPAICFLCDLSAVAKAGNDVAGAYARLHEAAAIVARTGGAPMARRLLIESDALLTSARTWEAQRGALKVTATVTFALPREERSAECTQTMSRLLWRIASRGWAASRDPLWRARRELSQVREAQGEQFSEQGRFILDAVDACYARAKGLAEAAQAEAARLDALSQGGFQLASFVAAGDASEHPAWRKARADESPASSGSAG